MYKDEINRIYKTEGLRGFYRGFVPQFFRDCPTMGVYFLSYNYLQRFLFGLDPNAHIKVTEKKKMMQKLCSGGLAG